MFFDVIEELNHFRKSVINFILLIIISFVSFIGYIIMTGIRNNFDIMIFVFLLLAWLLITITSILKMIDISKRVKTIKNDRLYPYIVRQVNLNWSYRSKGFDKDVILKTLITDRYGSFTSSYQVYGVEDNYTYEFSKVTNIISTGNTTNEIFNGTIIQANLNSFYQGVLQLRDRGKPRKYKKEGLIAKPYHSRLTEKYHEIKFFTTDEEIAKEIVSDRLVALYHKIKMKYSKKVVISIAQNKLNVAIGNRKDYLQFSILQKLTEEKINQKIEELKNINKTIEDMTKYIRSYL